MPLREDDVGSQCDDQQLQQHAPVHAGEKQNKIEKRPVYSRRSV